MTLSHAAAFAIAVAMMAGSASAHHAIGGAVPTTLWQGLLSGLGHPVIQFEHLLFVVAVAAALTCTTPRCDETAPPAAYLSGLAMVQALPMVACYFLLRRIVPHASRAVSATAPAFGTAVGVAVLWLLWI